jgi:3-hydroxy-9,10-secoandrosta-1,3,5(10)-triene-9,17-dione monooxygenase reductase component
MPDPIDQALYRQVMGHFPTGVVVVASPGPVGTAIGSFASLSLDPPLVTFSITKTSSSWPKIRETGVFCASVLAEDQEHVSRAFAQSGADKFAGLGYKPMATGSPRIDDCVAWTDCDITDVFDGGDHDIVVGRIRDMADEREAKPLVFFRGGYGL